MEGDGTVFRRQALPSCHDRTGGSEIGPYAKAAFLDGLDIPQIAGGLALAYRVGHYELLMNGGLAYATERLESTTTEPGETKHTYDLGVTLRYDIEQYFISGGYQHNSNGRHVGLDFIHAKGDNPGYDNIFVGVGIHF